MCSNNPIFVVKPSLQHQSLGNLGVPRGGRPPFPFPPPPPYPGRPHPVDCWQPIRSARRAGGAAHAAAVAALRLRRAPPSPRSAVAALRHRCAPPSPRSAVAALRRRRAPPSPRSAVAATPSRVQPVFLIHHHKESLVAWVQLHQPLSHSQQAQPRSFCSPKQSIAPSAAHGLLSDNARPAAFSESRFLLRG